MGLLRSETMKQGVLVLPPQDARRYIELIGKELNLQFEDMNAKDMRRPYRKHIQRIEEMERILRYITNEISTVTGYSLTKNKIQEFLNATDPSLKFDPLEAELAAQYKQFTSFKEHNLTLLTERNVAAEELQVVNRATELHQAPSGGGGINAPLMEGERAESRLSCIAGVVPVLEEGRLRMAIFRASRGNAFVDFFNIDTPITDPKTGASVQKAVFVVYFQAAGGASGPLHQKVSKVCNAIGVNVYAWPADRQAAMQRQKLLTIAVQEKDHALAGYREFMQAEMEQLTAPMHPGRNSRLEDWRIFCVQEKSIYTVLNMCHDSMMLRIGVWYPAADEDQIDQKLTEWHKKGSERAMLMKSKKLTHSPPTYIKTNEYTEPFQDVINTYGIPRYQEANPALFAIVTFPFIFGMMYGDVGHGSMLLMGGLYVVMNAEKFRYTVPVLFGARYMLVSLGFFATFAGFLYNDFFSIGFELFDSRFHKPGPGDHGDPNEYLLNHNFASKNYPGDAGCIAGKDCVGPYPFGLDSAWIDSSNELLFVNSMKMKLSVLMGVLQMVVGVLLRWSNACFERNLIDFVFECLPMMVFMLCFFGWMDFMILYKWVNPIDNPPSIINSMICMAMWPLGQKDTQPIYPGAFEFAMNLFLVVVATVPVMLFPKPFFLLCKHNAAQKRKAAAGYSELEDAEAGAGGHGHGDHGEFEFGEIFIHQIIETIEYVLGTVSHTASYLRIWALSLAHQQLSLVFFQKTLQMGLVMDAPWNGIVLYCMFAAWFVVTLAVLLGMDVLECFLHTLRLHWVEFQSKFYRADGYLFEPYGIKSIIVASSEE